jgi:hypothetical protein
VDADTIMARFAARAGWDSDSRLTLALRYIENQGANDAFRDFLAEQVADEEEMADAE